MIGIPVGVFIFIVALGIIFVLHWERRAGGRIGEKEIMSVDVYY